MLYKLHHIYEGGVKVSDLTKIQDIFQNFFTFQHSLLVILHTSPSDAPISVSRPNSIRRFSLQNNCSRRWLPLHLTKISVLRAQFLDEGTKRSRLGLDLVIKADGQAVQTVIREFSPCVRRCILLVKHDFLFLQMRPFFRKFGLQLVK